MTREEVYAQAMATIDQHNNVLLELPTGFGKSRVAIDMVNHLQGKLHKPFSVLLLVAKRVHKQNWQDEFDKWGLNTDVTVHMECYESLKKHIYKHYDAIVLDEIHHVKSDARLEYLSYVAFTYMIGLSATIPRDLKQYFKYHYHVAIVSTTLQDAITDDVLPEPEIILLPLELDNKKETEVIELNPKAKGMVYEGSYAKEFWKYKKMKVHTRLRATQKQYIQWLNNNILYYKNTFMKTHNEAVKMKWLKLCNDRLKFLAECKTPFVAQLLYRKRNCRTLTFCNNIAQAEELGTNSIHSKNVNAEKMLNDFNKGKINHITAVQMLNEGINLKGCQYAIFANLNASQTITLQRIGRALRHKHPKLIIPYYKGTREEELMQKMIEGYNTELIHSFNNLELNEDNN